MTAMTVRATLRIAVALGVSSVSGRDSLSAPAVVLEGVAAFGGSASG
jgi:hypothetical protein